MSIRQRRLVGAGFAMALGAAAVSAEADVSFTTDGGAPTRFGRPMAHARPPLPRLYPERIVRGMRPAVSPGQTYTIADVGAPGAPYSSSTPIGFNNTGQIFGQAFTSSRPGSLCLVNTGSAFVPVSTATANYRCTPSGIADAGSDGSFVLAGALTPETDPFSSAFVATYSASTKAFALKSFITTPYSQIVGVDAAGNGVGYSYAFFGTYQFVPFVYTARTGKFTALQPSCIVEGNTQANCLVDYSIPDTCPFGACAESPSGLVLGNVSSSGDSAIYNRSSNTYQDVPGQFKAGGNTIYVSLAVALSTYGLLGGGDNTVSSDEFAVVFLANSSRWTELAALKDSCTQHEPLSMNNAGEVLGIEANCSNSNDYGYWTWDPTTGVQRVKMPATTMYSYSYLLGVNDNRQLLASLQNANTGAVDWGTFNPVTPSMRRSRGFAMPRQAIGAHR